MQYFPPFILLETIFRAQEPTSRPLPRAPTLLPARGALDAARSLQALLGEPQQGAEGGGAAAGTGAGAAEEYLAALEAVLEARHKQLTEVGLSCPSVLLAGMLRDSGARLLNRIGAVVYRYILCIMRYLL